MAANRYLPRLVRYHSDGTKAWETIPLESGLAALEQSRLARLERLAKDCKSHCLDVELVEFATMGQGFANGSFAIVFSQRPRLDWFDAKGRWRGGSRFDLPTTTSIDPVGLALWDDELWLGLEGTLSKLQAAPALRGRVVDPEMTPIAGALVSLSFPNAGELQVRSTEDGTFAVPFDFADFPATVEVQAEGFLLFRGKGITRELLAEDFVLEPEPVVCVVAVERATGKPLQHFFLAVAHLTERTDMAEYRSGPPPLEVESEEGRGCLAAQLVPPLQVRVCSPGFACARKRLLTGGEVRIELDKEAYLEVHVQDQQGRPVANAEVGLLEARAARRLPRVSDEGFVRTDAKGIATFKGREEGDYLIQVHAEGFSPWARKEQLKIGTNILEVTLEAGADVTFLVREESGEPVFGAEVYVDVPGFRGTHEPICTTDKRGKCGLAGLQPGLVKVLVSDGAERELVKYLQIPHPGEVEIVFPTEGKLEGQLVGSHLYPGAHLVAVVSQAGFSSMTSVDPEGRFSFHKLQKGQALVKACVTDEHRGKKWVLASERVDIRGEREYLRLELPQPLRLFGTVTAGRRACAGCVLMFTLETDAKTGWTAVSAPDGSYQALLPRPGLYLVKVEHPDSGRRILRQLAVSSDQRWDVELSGAVLEGYVVMGSSQERVHGAAVRVYDAQNHLIGDAITPITGAFRFVDLPMGEVTVVASFEGAQGQRKLRLSEETQQIVVQLSASPEILVSLVHGSTGVPVTGQVRGVVLPPGGVPWAFAQTLEAGSSLQLAAFGEGEHTVIIYPQQPLAPTTVRLAPNHSPTTVVLWPRATLELLLPAGERASLQVRGVDGQPVAVQEAYPFFTREGTGMLVVNLPPGVWHVSLRGDNSSKVYSTQVTLSPLQRTSVWVHWQ